MLWTSRQIAIAFMVVVFFGAAAVAADQANSGAVRFERDVVPALTKAGCNSGACHGSFQGRGGLTLSLLGFDPRRDHDVLFKDGRGRRIAPAAPDESLLLRKATGRMAHGGGKRFEIGSPLHRVLVDYIAQGMAPPSAELLTVSRLEVVPRDFVLRIGEQAPIAVKAHWSDGVVRDVTATALFDALHEQLAEVTPAGQVTAKAHGRTAVTIRYHGQVAAIPVNMPFDAATAAGTNTVASTEPKPANLIDELVAAEWKKLGVSPAPLSSDAEFLRRVSLDLVGTLPTPEEIAKFLADPAPDKRAKLIDALLERPEYVDYWSLRWGDLLRAHRRYLGDKGLVAFRGWIRDSVRTNKPLDVMTRELLTAQGNLHTNGPVAYYFIDEKVEDLAETTAQVFMGVRMQCTRCHHHPFEVWGQEDYYGLAAFFSRLQTKDSGAQGARFGGPKSIRITPADNPQRKPVVAMPLRMFGEAPKLTDAEADVRRELADWLTKPDNPYFARNFANRAWASLFGPGLVEPVDDLRETNPASMPTVLDAITKDFVAHQFDQKHLLRTICNTRTYQLASELNPKRDADGRLCTHRVPKRIAAEVLLDAVSQATGTSEPFEGQPPGTRAISLPDPTIPSYFLMTFGRPLRNNPCECARGGTPDLAQALHLVNSTGLHDKVTKPDSRLGKLLAAKKTDNEIVPELYLATLSRHPTAEELAAVKELLAESPSREEGLQDLLWTLLNSTEFVFNH